MSYRKKQSKQVPSATSTLFQYLQFYILKSGNVIPNSYDFCIMGIDRGTYGGKLVFFSSKNRFLLNEGVLIFGFDSK